jgi:acyl-CoA dehydrogenase
MNSTIAADVVASALQAQSHEGIPFSLELSQDQRDVRDWVHGFAEKVVRPAAHEWDEREDTPWPLIQEAAKIGLYGYESLAQFWADPSGLTLPIVNEELFWGDAGIAMSMMGTTLAVAGIFSAGTPEQLGEWVPQCYGTADDPKVASFCVSEPDAGSDVAALRTRARYDAERDEWVLNGQKAWATNGGIAEVHVVVATVDPELGARGHAAFVIPPGTKGLEQGPKLKKHGLRASHTADVFLDDCRVPGSCLLGGKERLDERLARAREGSSSKRQAAMQTFEVSRPTVGAQAIRPCDHREPGDRLHAGRHEDGDRRRAPARMARLMDGTQRPRLRQRRGLDVEAEVRRGRRLGDGACDADPGRQRLRA